MKIISFLHSRYIINDSTKKYNRFTATAVKKIRIMGQEMTICNTSIKLWGKNSVTRSIIAPKIM